MRSITDLASIGWEGLLCAGVVPRSSSVHLQLQAPRGWEQLLELMAQLAHTRKPLGGFSRQELRLWMQICQNSFRVGWAGVIYVPILRHSEGGPPVTRE